MRRRKATISISLFPFLAVLLCAMGALILLLLVMARQIRHDTLAARPRPVAQEAPPIAVETEAPKTIPQVTITIVEPSPPAPPDPNVELRAKLAAVSARRDEAQRDVETLRRALERRQKEADAAKARAAATAFDREATQERLAAREAELRDREAERRRLGDEVREARGALAKVRQAVEAAEPKVSIVPYDGRSGTARRPILIECRGETIRFIPEDVQLTAGDLQGFPPDYNPLVAGAAALRGYWHEIDGPNSGKPYVLLLVHEDGIAAYYAARALLRPIGNDTGYELVTDELNLAVPQIDLGAQEVCRQAVQDTLLRRTELLAEVARRSQQTRPFSSGRFDDASEGDFPFEGFGDAGGPPVSPLPSRPPLGAFDGSRAPDAPAVTTADVAELAPLGPSGSPAGEIARRVRASSDRPALPPDSAERARRSTAASDFSFDEAAADPTTGFEDPVGGKKRWGQSAPTANISLERPMPITVTADEILVGSQSPISVTDGVTPQTVSAVLSAIDREAATWGRSPGQFYWSPRLRATVRPGGTGHYDRLRRHLAGTGLPGGDRIELGPPVPAFVELRYAQAEP